MGEGLLWPLEHRLQMNEAAPLLHVRCSDKPCIRPLGPNNFKRCAEIVDVHCSDFHDCLSRLFFGESWQKLLQLA